MTSATMSSASMLVVMCLCAGAQAGEVFELSSSYLPSRSLTPGYYACRSGLDFDSVTLLFDLTVEGRFGSYALRGAAGAGLVELSKDGSLSFLSGPFASNGAARTYAMYTTRSDGTPVIIVRYDFGDVVTDDYCAHVPE